MKLTYKTIDDFLKNIPNDIKGVLVYGPDEGQVREKIITISKMIVDNINDPFNVLDLTASEVAESSARISDELNSMSLMGGRKLIKISGADKGLSSSIENAITNYTGDNFLIIEGGDLTPTSPIRKLFEGEKKLAALPCYTQDERSLSYSIPQTIAKFGKTIDRDAIQYLSSCLVGDSGSITSQLEKLIIYVGNKSQISLEDSKACIIDNSDISLEKIVQKACSGNSEELEKELNKSYAEGISAVAILRIAQDYFKKMHFVKSQVEERIDIETALGSLRPPLFFKDKPIFIANLNNWNSKKLMSAMNGLIKAETLCKKTGYPPETVCSHTLHSIAKIAKR